MIEVRALTPADVDFVDQHLPLHRLDQAGGEYLVAWEDGVPLGHAHLDWRHDPPEVQDVFVLEAPRRGGSAARLSAAADARGRARGFDVIALDGDVENAPARALYAKLGYRERGTPPRRQAGTIMLRGEPFTFDVVLIDLVKEL